MVMTALFGAMAVAGAAAAVFSVFYRRPLWSLVVSLTVLVTAAAATTLTLTLPVDEPLPVAPLTVLKA